MSLITIDQLLESVDLDFEPRYVTKNYCGEITVFDSRPYIGCEEWCGDDIESICFGPINLPEFANKKWQECIYEVPRKTTGKIEKLNLLNDSALLWGKKINELVDMVNNIISVQDKMIDSRFVVDAVNELKRV